MSYSLSAEEYILSLILIGGEAAAYSIKDDVFGDISNEELQYRMDSAMNGLFSKGLLTIENNQEIVQPAFKEFLMSLTSVPRVIRCQTAAGNELVTTSIFFAANLTVQRSRYNNRVYELFTQKDDTQLSSLLSMSPLPQQGEPVLIEDQHFEKIIDQLLQQNELDESLENLLPEDIISVLKVNDGKLNSFYDYRFSNDSVNLQSFLYVTSNERTYKIEEQDGLLRIEPFSIQSLFQTV
ncbi:hypothetical protein ACFFJY_17495 [Fictibacillus aquaticus]|uniref:DUF5081 domain-containing protein n=1 Tax=Fictibacillus aquaticus TaxID=2021314 RepID=A0A235F5W7_9BACL|nr:hypothetical protein [Fictibacillus aquaticus]OYD56660.1 hypothetical protein CGZ90_16760 [Fictibacillus aquaticus]